MNYALIDNQGHTLMEFHTEEEAMMYRRRLAINTKEDVFVYRKIADINYKEKIEINIYGN
jgi:hypothetical protein